MSQSLFRSVLVASVVLSFAGSFCDLVFPGLVPASLRDADDALIDSLSRQFVITMAAGAVFIVIAQIVSTVGLFLFRPWAPGVAVIASLLVLAFWPVIGYQLYSGWATALLDLSNMLWGGILALVYFSPVRDWFKKDQVE